MTAKSRLPVVPPVIPSLAGLRDDGVLPSSAARDHRLPMPPIAAPRKRFWTYAVVALDDRGRIAARAILQRLAWAPGMTVSIREVSDLVVVTADPSGAAAVSPQGHLRLPARLRHRCRLVAGTQLLLVADTTVGRLVIHPQVVVDAMVAARYAEVFGGEVS